MRYADLGRHSALLMGCVLLAATAGCSALNGPAKTTPATTTAAPSASAASTAPTATPTAKPTTEPTLAVLDPAHQRSFTEATRLMQAGRNDDAQKVLTALVAANPELGGAHANLGVLHLRAGRPSDAVAAAERAVRANPKQATYANLLGVAHRHNGQFVQARTAYQKAIELDAAYAAPVLNLGILNDLYLANPTGAVDLYARYLILTPAGDAAVTKWVAELKGRKASTNVAVRQEKP